MLLRHGSTLKEKEKKKNYNTQAVETNPHIN